MCECCHWWCSLFEVAGPNVLNWAAFTIMWKTYHLVCLHHLFLRVPGWFLSRSVRRVHDSWRRCSKLVRCRYAEVKWLVDLYYDPVSFCETQSPERVYWQCAQCLQNFPLQTGEHQTQKLHVNAIIIERWSHASFFYANKQDGGIVLCRWCIMVMSTIYILCYLSNT